MTPPPSGVRMGHASCVLVSLVAPPALQTYRDTGARFAALPCQRNGRARSLGSADK